MKRHLRDSRVQLRQGRADYRQAQRNSRSDAQQLQVLNAKLGEGIGAKKERAKLLKKIRK